MISSSPEKIKGPWMYHKHVVIGIAPDRYIQCGTRYIQCGTLSDFSCWVVYCFSDLFAKCWMFSKHLDLIGNFGNKICHDWLNLWCLNPVDGVVVKPAEVIQDFCSSDVQAAAGWTCQSCHLQTTKSTGNFRGCSQEQDGIPEGNCQFWPLSWWW